MSGDPTRPLDCYFRKGWRERMAIVWEDCYKNYRIIEKDENTKQRSQSMDWLLCFTLNRLGERIFHSQYLIAAAHIDTCICKMCFYNHHIPIKNIGK